MIDLIFASAAALAVAPCNIPGEPSDYDKQHGIECGWVTVQRTEDDPTPIRLWVARVRASEPDEQDDPILFINGGPGIATIDSVLPAMHEWPTLTELRKHRDVVFFDQRGSGRSEEELCPALAETLKSIGSAGLTPEIEDERGRAAFAVCRHQVELNGGNLQAYTTLETVADIEALRQAFGASKLNLLSVSYGTLVAMQAMRSNPETIRSAILNSPYPPNSVTWAEQVSSAAASYVAIDRACSEQPDCRARFGALVPKLEATLARLEREPLKHGEKLITGRQFAKALWPLAVRSSTVRLVPEAIHRAHAGDGELIAKMVDMFAGGDSFGGRSPAQGLAISCHESGRTQAWYTRARTLYPGLVSAEPDYSWDRMCQAFRPGFAAPEFFAPVASDIPTLIYAGSFDPATPVVDAYQAMRFLTHATLVEVRGAAHAPMSVDDCTLGIALGFLTTPDKAPDVGCIEGRDPGRFPAEGLDEMFK